jgi:hypothetical protein
VPRTHGGNWVRVQQNVTASDVAPLVFCDARNVLNARVVYTLKLMNLVAVDQFQSYRIDRWQQLMSCSLLV